MLLKVFKKGNSLTDIGTLATRSEITQSSFQFFLDYAAQVCSFYDSHSKKTLNNLGNYKSFGDTKFIPRLSVEDFQSVIESSESPEALKLFHQVKNVMYSVDPEESLLIGYPGDKHVSGYYSPDITKADVDFVQSVLEERGISALNTRLFRASGGYQVMIASAETGLVEVFEKEGKRFQIIKGDFSTEMTAITHHMQEALKYVANENQEKMLKAYVESFKTGSIDAHKESQRHWIRDIGPVVETNIGFIETYRDPAGVRAEWEGFVAVVNKEMTKKFEALVNGAAGFIPRLPWSQDFEKDAFLKPDFTSLEVLTFATSGSPPAGM